MFGARAAMGMAERGSSACRATLRFEELAPMSAFTAAYCTREAGARFRARPLYDSFITARFFPNRIPMRGRLDGGH